MALGMYPRLVGFSLRRIGGGFAGSNCRGLEATSAILVSVFVILGICTCNPGYLYLFLSWAQDRGRKQLQGLEATSAVGRLAAPPNLPSTTNTSAPLIGVAPPHAWVFFCSF